MRGRSNVAIAAELHLGHQTVRNYVSAIFTQLYVVDRAEADRPGPKFRLGTG